MNRRLLDTQVRRSSGAAQVWRSLGAIATAAAAALGTMAVSTPAAAQEIQLTGPLAGAPAVRRLRLYREGRAEVALGAGTTLLDEYQQGVFATGRLQYNLFDWLGIGVFGAFAPLQISRDLTDKINTTAPRNSRTAVNLPPRQGEPGGQAYEEQTGKMRWMAAPQVTFSPFRGKLAIFQKLFVDTDLYLHGGAAFIGVEERGSCGAPGQNPCTAPQSFATESRVAIAPTFGLGLSFYLSGFLSLNLEYRALPFAWNRGGFDSRGTGPDASFPDQRIDEEDRTFKFNQMVMLNLGFHFPTAPKLSD
jgi:outer membrane beta-barrel protein